MVDVSICMNKINDLLFLSIGQIVILIIWFPKYLVGIILGNQLYNLFHSNAQVSSLMYR